MFDMGQKEGGNCHIKLDHNCFGVRNLNCKWTKGGK